MRIMSFRMTTVSATLGGSGAGLVVVPRHRQEMVAIDRHQFIRAARRSWALSARTCRAVPIRQTGLSDITLSWMLGKAKNLGLQIADSEWAQYALLDAKYALDQIHESWSLVWSFPQPRTVANNSIVSNSVVIRQEYDNSYQPENLTAQDGKPAAIFQTMQVVAEPPV